MLFRNWVLAIGFSIFVIAGCAGTPVDPKDETRSLVYGYFDMKDAPSALEWVSIKRYGAAGEWYYRLSAKDGLFWHMGIAPGSYQVEKFGGAGGIPLFKSEYEYNFGTKGRNDTAIRIQTPGVFFMGAYKYIDHAGGVFKQDKLEMKASTQPPEKELLQRVMKEIESNKQLSAYTWQINLAKKRLAELP
jgi:hypothetical protein